MPTSYGQLIHEKRRLLNLTEERLAEHTDISDRHIRNIENGTTIPKLDTIIKLANALNMNLGDLEDLEITHKRV